jgi:hypothetical protein
MSITSKNKSVFASIYATIKDAKSDTDEWSPAKCGTNAAKSLLFSS